MAERKTVAFVHPDLGIGGAERLVVDMAVGLQAHGHQVCMYTSHYDPQHSFPETKQLQIRVYGDTWLPRHCFGAFYIFFAILRNVYLCCVLCLHTLLAEPATRFDVIVVDQLSISIPILRCTGAKIVYYCHFPDQLLAKRTSKLRSLYRYPFDALEAWTTSKADLILVNSKFTQSVFHELFPRISQPTHVVYPGVALLETPPPLTPRAKNAAPFFLSINRFEAKKQIDVALTAFAAFLCTRGDAVLVVAGGYDVRVDENRAVLTQLQALCDTLSLQHVTAFKARAADPAPGTVLFLPSVAEDLKSACLARATALVYTPQHEHFGIVPVEAMAHGVPVIAMDSGGPAETVKHHETGYLCASATDMLPAMTWCAGLTADRRARVHAACREWVRTKFTREQMVRTLEALIST